MRSEHIAVSVWIYGSPTRHNAEITVKQVHRDGSADSVTYPVRLDAAGMPAEAEEWAKEALIQVIEAL